uniref:EEF1A lysine methyltransferase 2 n=1 Tax=Cercocebus atys TaxID=9531 RepID=A0A2K5LJJ5_CERAT
FLECLVIFGIKLFLSLSGSVIEKEGLSNIKLKVEDFLNLSTQLSGFHICIDKGTFDAISLNPDNAIEKRKQYVKSLSRVLKVKGFFLITSCNWTKEELLNEFSEGFELFEELPTPKFSFGGRSGNRPRSFLVLNPFAFLLSFQGVDHTWPFPRTAPPQG